MRGLGDLRAIVSGLIQKHDDEQRNNSSRGIVMKALKVVAAICATIVAVDRACRVIERRWKARKGPVTRPARTS